MKKIYLPSTGPDGWKAFLAEPEKHWKTGYSARALAHAWEAAAGLPVEVARLFDEPAELLIAIPEHKVPLPGGRRESQSDVFALIRLGGRTIAVMVEGKVNEPFGPTIDEWLKTPSDGKHVRLRFLCDQLGIAGASAGHVRYQLLHRSASALIEADRFKTDEAAMVVHSFSPNRMWFDDFARFAALFGAAVEPDRGCAVTLPTGRVLRLGWATGELRYLSA